MLPRQALAAGGRGSAGHVSGHPEPSGLQGSGNSPICQLAVDANPVLQALCPRHYHLRDFDLQMCPVSGMSYGQGPCGLCMVVLNFGGMTTEPHPDCPSHVLSLTNLPLP